MDFKCDELILGKTDADSRALTLITLVDGSRFEFASMGMSAVWALESLWPADVKKALLTLRFIAITLNKGMNAHAFLKLNLVSGHDLTLQNRTI